jgi:hypothetical protein
MERDTSITIKMSAPWRSLNWVCAVHVLGPASAIIQAIQAKVSHSLGEAKLDLNASISLPSLPEACWFSLIYSARIHGHKAGSANCTCWRRCKKARNPAQTNGKTISQSHRG